MLALAATLILPSGAHTPQMDTTGRLSTGIQRAIDAAAALPEPLRRLVPPTATATVTITPSPTATPTASATPTVPANGLVKPGPPFLAFRRPFDPPHEDRPSRSYPYGTTGGGAYLLHHGVDIGNPTGTLVLAAGDGRVVYAGSDAEITWGPEPDFYGLLVVLEHSQDQAPPLYSLYGHLSRTLVEAGQWVDSGTPIGEVGSTGIALGPHLHLEFRSSDRDYASTTNPELYLAPSTGAGVVVGTVCSADGAQLADAPVSLFQLDANGGVTWWASSQTYPGTGVNSAPYWRENVVFGDVPAGTYRLATDYPGATVDLVVQAGLVTRTTIVVAAQQ